LGKTKREHYGMYLHEENVGKLCAQIRLMNFPDFAQFNGGKSPSAAVGNGETKDYSKLIHSSHMNWLKEKRL
jgi:hypothetical protein